MDQFNSAFSELWIEMPKSLHFVNGEHVRVYGTLDREYNDGWWWKELNPVWCLQAVK